jgi:hypothetical protein
MTFKRLSRQSTFPDLEIEYEKWLEGEIYTLDKWAPRDVGWFHPSSASGCPRRGMLEFLGVKPDASPVDTRSHKTFGNGHGMHRRLQRDFLDMGLFVTKEMIEVPGEDVGIPMHGHADGILHYEDFDFPIVDFKSISDGGFRYVQKAPKEDHVDQVHCYMHLLKKKWAVLLYENKNNHDWKIHWVKWDAKRWRKILSRFEEILDAVKVRNPPKRAGNNKQSDPCRMGSPRFGYWYCPYLDRCHGCNTLLSDNEWNACVGRLSDAAKKKIGYRKSRRQLAV